MSGLDFDVGGGADGFGESCWSGVSYGQGFDVLDQGLQSYSNSVSYDVRPTSYDSNPQPRTDQQSLGGQVSYGDGGGYIKYESYQNNAPTYHQQTEFEPRIEEAIKEEPVEVKVEETSEFIRSKPDITISNVVSNFRCRCHLNLRKIAITSKNCIYKRDQGKVMMKIRDPNMMANIWSSGKIVCQGAKSEDDAKRGSRKFARIIQKVGFPKVRVSNYKVVNVLGNCRLPFAIDIMQFSSHNAGPHCSYEPELHPAVTFKPGNTATVKIFSTGALTILGKNVDTVQTALDLVYPLVYQFRKNRSDRDVDKDADSDKEEF